MNTDNFINDFAKSFESTSLEAFKLNTRFRELNEWDSLSELTIIAMIDKKYGINIPANKFAIIETLEELMIYIMGETK
jgi:acyl carrier protein